MTEEKPNPFTLIKHVGEPNKAEFEGVTVTRQEKLFIREWKALVRCTPYDNHFVFEIPHSRKKMGMSEYLCTCGSAAVVVKLENERERMFVCLFYHSRLIEDGHGYHQTAIVNKDSFDQIAGETLDPKGKKWLI